MSLVSNQPLAVSPPPPTSLGISEAKMARTFTELFRLCSPMFTTRDAAAT